MTDLTIAYVKANIAIATTANNLTALVYQESNVNTKIAQLLVVGYNLVEGMVVGFNHGSDVSSDALSLNCLLLVHQRA